MFSDADKRERQKRLKNGTDAKSLQQSIATEVADGLSGHIYAAVQNEMKEAYRTGESSYYVDIEHFFTYLHLIPPGYSYPDHKYRGQFVNYEVRKKVSAIIADKIADELRCEGVKVRRVGYSRSSINVKF